jgi:hypothetical protein
MGRSDNTVEDWAYERSPDRRHMLGAIRRMAVKLTEGAFWRIAGHILLDRKVEAKDAEVFGGIGFHSRPKPGANAEAIVVFPGGASNPCVVGLRDEDLRKQVAQLDHDETCTFNSLTIIHHTNDGFVEIRTPGGAAFALPTLADYNRLRNAFNSHDHPYVNGTTPATTGGAISATDTIPVPAPTGTQVLKTG